MKTEPKEDNQPNDCLRGNSYLLFLHVFLLSLFLICSSIFFSLFFQFSVFLLSVNLWCVWSSSSVFAPPPPRLSFLLFFWIPHISSSCRSSGPGSGSSAAAMIWGFCFFFELSEAATRQKVLFMKKGDLCCSQPNPPQELSSHSWTGSARSHAGRDHTQELQSEPQETQTGPEETAGITSMNRQWRSRTDRTRTAGPWNFRD